WMANLLHGNLGFSFSTYQSVAQMIGERIGPTALLMGLSVLFGLILAIPLGILSAVKQHTKLDYLTTGGAFIGISVPTFFLGLALIYLFSIQFNLLPSGGMITLGGNDGFGDRILHLV